MPGLRGQVRSCEAAVSARGCGASEPPEERVVAAVFRPSARDADNLAVPVRQPDEEIRGIPAPPRRPTHSSQNGCAENDSTCGEKSSVISRSFQPRLEPTAAPRKRRSIAPRSSAALDETTRRDTSD